MDWLSPTNKIRWMEAFTKKAKKVTLCDDREFVIRYGKNKDNEEVAHVRPKKGFIPVGDFLLSKVTDPIWLTKNDMQVEPAPRPEGAYMTMLRSFINSQEKGVSVGDHWPDLSHKKAASLKQGFTKARQVIGHPAKDVEVVVTDGQVYLLKKDKGKNGK